MLTIVQCTDNNKVNRYWSYMYTALQNIVAVQLLRCFLSFLIAHEQPNGPNCYVFVTGMTADVIKELASIKVPVNMLLNVEVKLNKQTGQ